MRTFSEAMEHFDELGEVIFGVCAQKFHFEICFSDLGDERVYTVELRELGDYVSDLTGGGHGALDGSTVLLQTTVATLQEALYLIDQYRWKHIKTYAD